MIRAARLGRRARQRPAVLLGAAALVLSASVAPAQAPFAFLAPIQVGSAPSEGASGVDARRGPSRCVRPRADDGGSEVNQTGPPGPRLRRDRLLLLTAAALATSLAGGAIGVDRDVVPAQGLDRSDVTLAIDRRAVRARDERFDRASNWMVGIAVAFPLVAGALGLEAEARAVPTDARRAAGEDLAPGGDVFIPGMLRRLALYAQASFLNDGLTLLLKNTVSRPRPGLYMPWAEAAGTPEGWSFESFPSGHASRAGCAAAFGVFDHLMTRSYADWREHFATGLAAGALAGATAALRVEAGEHFPTDVAGGLALGVACGVGVPLLHGYAHADGAPVRPRRSAWLASWGGMAAGVALAAAASSLLGP